MESLISMCSILSRPNRQQYPRIEESLEENRSVFPLQETKVYTAQSPNIFRMAITLHAAIGKKSNIVFTIFAVFISFSKLLKSDERQAFHKILLLSVH